MTSVFITGKTGEAKGKKAEWRQIEIGIRKPKAKEHEGPAEAERGKEGFFPWALKEHSPVNILIWDFWSPEL